MSTAVDMFLRQVSLTGGIPFRVGLPKAPTSIDADGMTDKGLPGPVRRPGEPAVSSNPVWYQLSNVIGTACRRYAVPLGNP